MGVSTGQIFQPKLMQVVEPQKRESTWEQVLPTILTSLAQTAVGSYIKNQFQTQQQEQEMLAKGYTKNPDGTWNRPQMEVKEVVPGIYSYSYGGQAGLHNAPKTSATTVEELLGLDTIEKIKANPENKSQIIADALKAKHPTSTEQVLQDLQWPDGTVGPGILKNGQLTRPTIGQPGQVSGQSSSQGPFPMGAGLAPQPQSGAAPTQAKQTISANAFSPTTRATPAVAPITPTQPVAPSVATPITSTQPSTTAQVVGQAAPQYAVSAKKDNQTQAELAAGLEAKKIKQGGVLSQDDQATLDGIYGATKGMAGARAEATFGAERYKDVPVEEQEWSYQDWIIRDKTPKFARNDRENMAAWEKGKLAYMKANNITPSDIAAIQWENKTHGASMTLQNKSLGMMRSFVSNIDKQTQKLDELLNSEDFISRAGARAIDKPIRELKKSALGEANERTIDMYVTELQRELNKLTSGNPASIAEMSESSRKTWEHIYDPSLPLKDLKSLGDQVRELAKIRMQSLEESIQATSDAIRNRQTLPTSLYGGANTPAPQPSPTPAPTASPAPSTTDTSWDKFDAAFSKKYPNASPTEKNFAYWQTLQRMKQLQGAK